MEQPCYKCGQRVEEGTPFCPHCSAPQIRVMIAERAPSTAAYAAAAGALSESSAVHPTSEAIPALDVPVQWSRAMQPCALAALIAAAAMVLKLMVPLIAAICAGFLAVAFYRRSNPGSAIRAGLGARLGAICGLFCTGMTAILALVRVTILHESGEIRQALLDAIQVQAARYPDPQFQASLEFMRSPAGLAVMMGVLVLFGLVTFLVLGTLGGALGGAALGRRDRG